MALRVNPDVAAETHPYISTGLHKHKFGVPIRDARTLYAKASGARYLKVRGVSVHIGSQITDVAPFGEAMARVADLVRELRTDGHHIDYIDAGGGLASPTKSRAPMIFRPVLPLTRGRSLLRCGLERDAVAGAGAIDHRPRRRFAHFGGLRKSERRQTISGGRRRHERLDSSRTLWRLSRDRSGDSAGPFRGRRRSEVTDIVGPVCETGDFFARDRELPPVEEGDLLAILDAGAYGMVLASNYNTRPRPPRCWCRASRSK